jgi:eukaryotic-like serine/threonine-protein kinase
MVLKAGARLGAYEIVELLGTGGMGEVYRAHDSALGRDVAIKTLPEAWLTDPDRRSRVDREARALAALSHPHVGAIYGLVNTDGVPALVLELVEGPTLADRLAVLSARRERGAGLALPEAMNIARQIADALDAAHEKGIVHRDLKPANIKVTQDGIVKVLDFGLAKLGPGEVGWGQASEENLTNSPTFAIGGTKEGVLLGTAPYMSPEQARGRPVDKRTDIWAFGCVLYEMLTGRASFAGDSLADTMVAILEREPNWTALPSGTPATVRRLLARCLEKDPKRRLRDIGDARIEIDEALASPGGAIAKNTVGLHGRTTLGRATAVIASAAVGALVAWSLKPGASTPPATTGTVARLVITPSPAEPLATDLSSIAISPDGRRVAYAAGLGRKQRIYVREIDSFGGAPIPGTEGGTTPFFSPDGQWLGFLSTGKMKKVLVTGGAPLTICDTQGAGAATPSWEADGTIFFTPTIGAGVWRVAAAGGTPTPVTMLQEAESSHRWAQLVPNGKALLFSAITASASAQTYAQSLDTGQRRLVVQGAAARYLPTGHLVYVQGGTVMAVPFDPDRLEVLGSPVAVLAGVMQVRRLRNSTTASFLSHVSFSNAGPMAYVPGSERLRRDALVWVDRGGQEQPTGATGGMYFQPRLSPDGTRMAVTVGGSDYDDVWLYDLARSAWSRFTLEGNNGFPLWTPDGHKLTYVSDKAGPDNMYSKPLDGSGADERVVASDLPNYPFSWSRDGVLAFVSVSPRTQQDLWILRPDQNKRPTPLLETPFGEGAPVFSPDGRQLAYVSNESGRTEIYIRPFPGPGQSVTISTDGGNEPVWSRTGRELFYRSGDAMMAVDITAGPGFAAGRPKRLFERPFESSLTFWANYDVASDGQRFLMVKRLDQDEAPAQINVMLNWGDELKRLVPRSR